MLSCPIKPIVNTLDPGLRRDDGVTYVRFGKPKLQGKPDTELLSEQRNEKMPAVALGRRQQRCKRV